MNALERLLQDDLDRLVDRLAATTREGALVSCGEREPQLLSHLESAETHLSDLRQDLLLRYAMWQDALDHCADVWALVDLAEDAPLASARRAA